MRRPQHIVALFMFLTVRNSAYRCASICECIVVDGELYGDCSNTELTALPLFGELPSLELAFLDVSRNNIVNLDKNVIESWPSLRGVSLLKNPLNCTQISLFKTSTSVLSDCKELSTFSGM